MTTDVLPFIQVCTVFWLIQKPQLSVKELAENIQTSQTTIRRHLSIMEKRGVVKSEGYNPVRYSIAENSPEDFLRQCHSLKSEYELSLFLRGINL